MIYTTVSNIWVTSIKDKGLKVIFQGIIIDILEIFIKQFCSQYVEMEHSKCQLKKCKTEHLQIEYLNSMWKKYKS